METAMVGKTYGPQTMFKSYYVVWKHVGVPSANRYITCLNRTMQYGNLGISLLIWDEIKFKSYYVVWKLNAKVFFHKIHTCGLNRTMQYGN